MLKLPSPTCFIQGVRAPAKSAYAIFGAYSSGFKVVQPKVHTQVWIFCQAIQRCKPAKITSSTRARETLCAQNRCMSGIISKTCTSHDEKHSTNVYFLKKSPCPRVDTYTLLCLATARANVGIHVSVMQLHTGIDRVLVPYPVPSSAQPSSRKSRTCRASWGRCRGDETAWIRLHLVGNTACTCSPCNLYW